MMSQRILKLLLDEHLQEETRNRQFIRDFELSYLDFSGYLNFSYDTLAEEFMDNMLHRTQKKITSRSQFEAETEVIFEKYYMPARPNQEEIESPMYVLFALNKNFSVLPSDVILALYSLHYLGKIEEDKFLYNFNQALCLNQKSVKYFLFNADGSRRNLVYSLKEETFLAWAIVPEFLEIDGFIEFLMLVLQKKYKKFFWSPSIVYRRKLPSDIFSVGYIGYERYGIKMPSSDVTFDITKIITEQVNTLPRISLFDLLKETSLSKKKIQSYVDMAMISYDSEKLKIPRWLPLKPNIAQKGHVNDLIAAILREQYGKVKSYLQANRELVNQFNSEQMTPLMIAVVNKKFPAVVMMISVDPDVLLMNGEGKNVIELAVGQPRFFAIFLRQAFRRRGFVLDFNLLKKHLDIYHNSFELLREYYLQELGKMFFAEHVPLEFEIRRYLLNPHRSSDRDKGIQRIAERHAKKGSIAAAREQAWLEQREYFLQFWLNPKVRLISVTTFINSLKISDKLNFTENVRSIARDFIVNKEFDRFFQKGKWLYNDDFIADMIELITFSVTSKFNLLFWFKLQLWHMIFGSFS